MDFLFILLLALSLSTDSFTVSLAMGVAYCKVGRQQLRLAIIVGVLHFVLSALGALMFHEIGHYISIYGNYIAFGLLALLGGRMIVEGLRTSKHNNEKSGSDLTLSRTLLIALAVSLDAFVVGGAVGVTNMEAHTLYELTLFSVVVGLCSTLSVLIGIALGCRLGRTFGNWATLVGGAGLIALGLKFLLT